MIKTVLKFFWIVPVTLFIFLALKVAWVVAKAVTIDIMLPCFGTFYTVVIWSFFVTLILGFFSLRYYFRSIGVDV